MKTLPVHELFYTWQGEGVFMGQPAFFLRLFGCPVKCPWCDSAGTWHPDHIPTDIRRMTKDEILHEVFESHARRVVITGGEPTIHDMTELTQGWNDGVGWHLETSGSFPIKGNFDWITLSPKRWKLPLPENVRKASEFKLIIEAPIDIEYYWTMLIQMGINPEKPIWLHPEWSQRDNKEVLESISNAVKSNKAMFRAGWQLHKLYKVDSLDPRTQPLVPLGGDPAKGF